MVRNWIRNVVNYIFVKQFIEYRCTLYLIKGVFVISYILIVLVKNGIKTHNTVKRVYKGHSTWKCALYIEVKIIYTSLMGEMRLPFIDSDLLYRGAL